MQQVDTRVRLARLKERPTIAEARPSMILCSTCGEGVPLDAGFCLACGRRQKVVESQARPTLLLADRDRARPVDTSDRSSMVVRTTQVLLDLLPQQARGTAIRTTQKLADLLPEPSKALDLLFGSLIALGVIIVILEMILL